MESNRRIRSSCVSSSIRRLLFDPRPVAIDLLPGSDENAPRLEGRRPHVRVNRLEIRDVDVHPQCFGQRDDEVDPQFQSFPR